MGGSGRRMRRTLALLGAGLALLGSGCARTDGTESSAVADPPLLEDARLFGAAEPAAGVSTPGQTAAAPLLYDPAQVPEAPPTALPLSEL